MRVNRDKCLPQLSLAWAPTIVGMAVDATAGRVTAYGPAQEARKSTCGMRH